MAVNDRPEVYDRDYVNDRHEVHDRPAVYDRHDTWRVERLMLTAAALIFALSCLLVALWMTMSEPKSKLYEADNMVCASQPFTMNCWERKPR